MFSFPLLEGNALTALSSINNIVLTQKLAKKLFGKENAMGKTVRIDSSDYFTVTGVMQDLPNNTRFTFEYLLPWTYMIKLGRADSSWGNNSLKTFVLLKPNVSQTNFDAKISNVTINHSNPDNKSTTQVFTQLLSDSWLYSKSENGKFVGGVLKG
jgi:hypothetical protein